MFLKIRRISSWLHASSFLYCSAAHSVQVSYSTPKKGEDTQRPHMNTFCSCDLRSITVCNSGCCWRTVTVRQLLNVLGCGYGNGAGGNAKITRDSSTHGSCACHKHPRVNLEWLCVTGGCKWEWQWPKELVAEIWEGLKFLKTLARLFSWEK